MNAKEVKVTTDHFTIHGKDGELVESITATGDPKITEAILEKERQKIQRTTGMDVARTPTQTTQTENDHPTTVTKTGFVYSKRSPGQLRQN